MSMAGDIENQLSPEDEFVKANADYDSARADQPAEDTNAPDARDQAASTAPAEPFEGYSALPEAIRKRFDEAEAARKAIETDLGKVRGDYGRLRTKSADLERQLAKSRTPTAREAPAPQNKAQLDKQLSKWRKHAEEYPEDAQAIEELIGSATQQFEAKFGPIERRIDERYSTLDQRLQQLEERERRAAAVEHQSRLTELVPNWKRIAGWEDADGKPVPIDQQAWDPQFQGWLESFRPAQRERYQELLSSGDPDDAAEVMIAFNRDYYIERLTAEQAPPQNTAGSTPNRRQKALEDVSPTGVPNGMAHDIPALSAGEDEYARTIAQFGHLLQ